MKIFDILGIRVSLLSPTEVPPTLEKLLAEKQPQQIVTVNPEFIVEAYRNKDYHTLLRNAALATADGTGLIFAARFRGVDAHFSDRVTGITLTQELFSQSLRHAYPVAIVLKNNSLTSKALLRQKLDELYPGLSVHIFQEPVAITEIISCNPKILLVALGSPAQEFWIRDALREIPGGIVAMGVGGTFDFISGKIQRAPRILRRLGFEWLWRFILEPKRLPRIIRAVIVFPYIICAKRQ